MLGKGTEHDESRRSIAFSGLPILRNAIACCTLTVVGLLVMPQSEVGIANVGRALRPVRGGPSHGVTVVAKDVRASREASRSTPTKGDDSDQWELDEAFGAFVENADEAPSTATVTGQRPIAPDLPDDNDVDEFLRGSETELFGEELDEPDAKSSSVGK